MRRTAVLILLLIMAAAAAAQDAAPAADYGIRDVRPARYDPAAGQVTVTFDVANSGGAAAAVPATALVYLADGTEVARGFINPLQPGARASVELRFLAADFPAEFTPGSTVSLRIAVGLDEVEASGSDTAGDNLARVSVQLPLSAAETTPEPAAPDGALNVLGITIDTSSPVTMALLIAGGGAALVLLLIALLIIRLLLPRKPRGFGAWNPPYAGLPVYDPLTTAGRRQGWQPFAQSDQPPLARRAG